MVPSDMNVWTTLSLWDFTLAAESSEQLSQGKQQLQPFSLKSTVSSTMQGQAVKLSIACEAKVQQMLESCAIQSLEVQSVHGCVRDKGSSNSMLHALQIVSCYSSVSFLANIVDNVSSLL